MKQKDACNSLKKIFETIMMKWENERETRVDVEPVEKIVIVQRTESARLVRVTL